MSRILAGSKPRPINDPSVISSRFKGQLELHPEEIRFMAGFRRDRIANVLDDLATTQKLDTEALHDVGSCIRDLQGLAVALRIHLTGSPEPCRGEFTVSPEVAAMVEELRSKR